MDEWNGKNIYVQKGQDEEDLCDFAGGSKVVLPKWEGGVKAQELPTSV